MLLFNCPEFLLPGFLKKRETEEEKNGKPAHVSGELLAELAALEQEW